jgi:hypothetical protein
MAMNVYTKIIDLSEYLQDIPGTIGFVPILSKRGPDNQLTFIGNGTDFINKFGNPDITQFGKNFGQGPYIAKNHLTNATSLYITRCLPWDATYSNLFLALQLVSPEETSSSSDTGAEPYKSEIVAVSFQSMNSVTELDSRLTQSVITDWVNDSTTGGTGLSDGFLCYFRSVGRGDSYDDFSIRLTKSINPYKQGIYLLEIFEIQSDGDPVVVESFEVSFDPKAKGSDGDSIYIEDTVNRFSANLRCKVNPSSLNVLEEAQAEFHKNEAEDTYPNNPYVTDEAAEYSTIQDYIDAGGTDLGFKEWTKNEKRILLDAAETALSDALEALQTARELPQSTISEINSRNAAIQNATEDVALARTQLNTAKQEYEDTVVLDILTTQDYDSVTAVIDAIPLSNGSDGTLFDYDLRSGKPVLNEEVATQILSMGYMGLLENPVNSEINDEILNTDNIFIDIVYDAGYNVDVKTSAAYLVDETRRDCIMITDNGDNNNYEQAKIAADSPAFNSRYIARYEGYSTVYDVFTGKDIDVSPVYHMSKIIPLTDKEYEIWYAPAGFNRAVIDDIKALRWSPKLGERDQLYLLQLNPIVKFNVGYTVWGQLTTQKKSTALQDLNVMRLVLYIKRMLEQFLKYYIFEFNDTVTHNKITQEITPFLESIKKRRGLSSYEVEVGATEYEFKRKICHVNVTLSPMKIIERIELNLYIK